MHKRGQQRFRRAEDIFVQLRAVDRLLTVQGLFPDVV
jgi:hypothetical protein